MGMMEELRSFFTPAHKKPVEEHLIRDSVTRRLIEDTEELLVRIAENKPKSTKVIKRKQREWSIKVKMKQPTIQVIMTDTKHSTAPIKKRITIICYRKYIKAVNGVGVCKEASIHYLKDGRSQTRSIKDSPLFQTLFYRIHYLDSVLSNDLSTLTETPKSLLQQQEQLLKTSDHNQLHLLLDEAKRYKQLLSKFQVDPSIEHRLQRILEHSSLLADDFMMLDFEEKHIVRRMLREDIPSLLHTYISLSTKHQLEQKENVYLTLFKMELTLIDYKEKLEKERVTRMDQLFKLQSMRYDRNS
ncbi:hypothetical protein [Halalkalibacter hemicellulosilyticus]|uniref:Uncharacterized protein n=1 Tax=Halalkalibacter hemicellulosilyticusJCM 9152 TaxID=1236971 RepID=W4QBM8_9BACI|nr:hypothetical protein [Halalkalibacter hemicellulosilyticus]GAE29083.1 hypothetical protein JCM9152_422 [Halalkalibacter hemicellulosilyticusJCM 9152]